MLKGMMQGTVGAVLTALLFIFADDIRSLWPGSGSEPLIGKWGCEWSVTRGEHKLGSTVPDTLTFQRVSEDTVSGYGEEATAGKYLFEGRNSTFAVSLAYAPTGANRNFVGVAILRKKNFTDSLSGEWFQYVDEGEFSGGAVTCSKHGPSE